VKSTSRIIQVLLVAVAVPLAGNLASTLLVEQRVISPTTSWQILVAIAVLLAMIEVRLRIGSGGTGVGLDPNRTYLVQAVQRLGVNPYLRQLQGHPLADLAMRIELENVSEVGGFGSRNDRQVLDLSELAENLPVRMLLLGDPGYGKSICMAKITERLGLHAQNDSTSGIPCMLSLGSWTRFQTRGAASFALWARREITRLYGRPPDVSGREYDRWLLRRIEEGGVALILDGLDEVPVELRSRCVLEINAFMATLLPSSRVVVACRSADYEPIVRKAGTRLDLLRTAEAYRILPLTLEQIQAGVGEGSPLAAALRSEEQGVVLRQVLRAPLFLDLARQHPASAELSEITDPEELQRVLLQSLVVRAASASEIPNGWTPDEALEALRGLAEFLTTSDVDRSVFLPEDLLEQTSGRTRLVTRMPIGAAAVAGLWLTWSYLPLLAVRIVQSSRLAGRLDMDAALGNVPTIPAVVVALLLSGAILTTYTERADERGPGVGSGSAQGCFFFLVLGVFASTFPPNLATSVVIFGGALCTIFQMARSFDATMLRLEVARRVIASFAWLPADIDAFIQWGVVTGLLRPAAGRGISFRHREIRELLVAGSTDGFDGSSSGRSSVRRPSVAEATERG
jgi:hypothetical protein